MKKSKSLRDYHIGLSAGLVTGISLFVYQEGVRLGVPTWLVFLGFILTFIILYSYGKPKN